MTELLPGMEGEQRSAALSQWYTPPDLAVRIVEWALQPHPNSVHTFRCLEPSAGRGALAIPLRERVRTVTCCELDPQNEEYLLRLGFEVWGGDFFDCLQSLPPFDLAVMNPPFEGGQTERHIMHALKLASRVVCHCPLSTLAGQARYTSLWRKVNLHRLAICSSRPKYGADGGKTDMCTIDVTLADAGYDHPEIEWWP